MNEELIDALENRLEHGEDKESLRFEVLAAGHSNEVFEEAFREANLRYQMGGGGEDSEVSFADTATLEVTNIPQTRARGDLYTLKVVSKSKGSGLIGYIDLLKTGWQIGKESVGLFGGLMASFLILSAAIVVFVLAVGGYIASDLFVENTVTLAVLLGLVAVGYLFAIVYISLAGFAFFRGILLRKEGVRFWPHFRWAWRHIIPIFLLIFYIQIITQAGFILFVIPGLVATIYLGYAKYVLAQDDVRGIAALIRSFELVYGRFWAIVGRKLFLIAVIFMLVIAEAALLSIEPLLGLLGLPFLILALYVVFCAVIALYESVIIVKLIHIFSERDQANLKKWLIIVVLVGLFFSLVSFFNMISSIDSSQEYPEIEKIINSIRDNNSNDDAGEQNLIESRINATQVKLITSYMDEISASAELYKEVNGSYAGVCSDAEGVNALLRYAYDSGSNDIFCQDDRNWYIAEAELGDSGTYYCVDSVGNSLIQQQTRNSYETCLDR